MHKSLCSLLALLATLIALPANAATPVTDIVTVDPRHILNAIDPFDALGAGVDGHEKGENDAIYTRRNISAMKSAGFGALTYRLRTELGVEAWHWNPVGTWSDPARKQGYWTSSAAVSGAPATVSYGYRLPRRGSTIDQANDDGYSRIDDGSAATYWKSNPYLDKAFTGDDNALHPQWVAIDLLTPHPLNTLHIDWATPYALQFSVQAWIGYAPPSNEGISDTEVEGTWRTLDSYSLPAGGTPVSVCQFDTVSTRFMRIVMTESSGNASPMGGDPRDTVGYAIREVSLGLTDTRGVFHDDVVHSPMRDEQTIITASSCDPWHSASDIDPRVEQPSFTRVFKSGLDHGRPVLVPTGLIYDTPDNAAAELRWLRANSYPVKEMELGEEADGQLFGPEDYGALYSQFADALHRVDPTVKLGGPSFQTDLDGWRYWQDAHGEHSWMKRFLAYLSSHGHLADFTFFSFEWYPFDDPCANPQTQLAIQPSYMSFSLAHDSVPATIPMYLSEYGYSAFAGINEVTMAGALMNTDIALSFLAHGGKRAYFYGYEPDDLMQEVDTCPTYGNLCLFIADKNGQAAFPLATYQAARLLTQQWLEPCDKVHNLIAATPTTASGAPSPLIAAFAVIRPDGKTAIVLLNKDGKHAHTVRIVCPPNPAAHSMAYEEWQYSASQYVWHPDGRNGYAKPNLPPAHSLVANQLNGHVVTLPPFSMTLLRTQ